MFLIAINEAADKWVRWYWARGRQDSMRVCLKAGRALYEKSSDQRQYSCGLHASKLVS